MGLADCRHCKPQKRVALEIDLGPWESTSPEELNFEGVINSAPSADLLKTKSRGLSSGECPEPRRPQAKPPPGAPLDLGPLDLVFGEAALAAVITT